MINLFNKCGSIGMSFLLCLAVVSLSLACSKSDQATEIESMDTVSLEDAEYAILFVGNSLTYFNDMPSMVQELASLSGKQIAIEVLAYPNYAISDHWADGTVQTRIQSGFFDFVVIQQGPSSQPAGRNLLIQFGERYKALCDEHNAELAFFMVWPSRDLYHTFDGVIRNYTDAARMNDAILCPVGQVWKNHFDTTNDFSYYGPDQFHPSKEGSEVAAQVIWNSLPIQ